MNNNLKKDFITKFNIPTHIPQRARGWGKLDEAAAILGEIEAALPVKNTMTSSDPLFQPYKAVICEIGFGTGERLVAQALREPDNLFIGCEVYLFGLVKLYKYCQENHITNILLWPGDGMDMLAAMPAGRIDECYVLFPDPWRKKRHHKRRLVQLSLLDSLALKLHPQGRLKIATDHPDYQEYIHAICENRKNSWNFDFYVGQDKSFCDEHDIFTRYAQHALGKAHAIHVFNGNLWSAL